MISGGAAFFTGEEKPEGAEFNPPVVCGVSYNRLRCLWLEKRIQGS